MANQWQLCGMDTRHEAAAKKRHADELTNGERCGGPTTLISSLFERYLDH